MKRPEKSFHINVIKELNMSEGLIFKGSSTYQLKCISNDLFKLINLTYNKLNTNGILYSSKELINFLKIN